MSLFIFRTDLNYAFIFFLLNPCYLYFYYVKVYVAFQESQLNKMSQGSVDWLELGQIIWDELPKSIVITKGH